MFVARVREKQVSWCLIEQGGKSPSYETTFSFRSHSCFAAALPSYKFQESQARKIHDSVERRRDSNLQSRPSHLQWRQRRKSERCSHHVPARSKCFHHWLRSTRMSERCPTGEPLFRVKFIPRVTPRRVAIQSDEVGCPKRQARIVHSVAFSSGLFSMSEIAFDKEHHFAAVRYSFWCGPLCGHGRTLVFENVNGEWRNANRNCGYWIS
jgi:hypothetical protein